MTTHNSDRDYRSPFEGDKSATKLNSESLQKLVQAAFGPNPAEGEGHFWRRTKPRCEIQLHYYPTSKTLSVITYRSSEQGQFTRFSIQASLESNPRIEHACILSNPSGECYDYRERTSPPIERKQVVEIVEHTLFLCAEELGLTELKSSQMFLQEP